MTTNTSINDQVDVPDAPLIPGLTFRCFRDGADYVRTESLINACNAVDDVDVTLTASDITTFHATQSGWNPRCDTIFAEVDGITVGTASVFYEHAADGTHVFFQPGYVAPAWRQQGIGRAMLHYQECRSRAMAVDIVEDGERYLEMNVFDSEMPRRTLLQQEGYRVVRYGYQMARSLEHVGETAELPASIELRPVLPIHMEAILAAFNEAFLDHWNWVPWSLERWQQWTATSSVDTTLWCVAWEGEQIAGMSLNRIDPMTHVDQGCRRGWIESVCVRRPWRGHGIARALLSASFERLRSRGMTQAELMVDAENPTGALHLYERMGFAVVKRTATYRKVVDTLEAVVVE